MSFTDYLENEVLDHILGGADYARPATVYIALSTTQPSDNGSGFTEPGVGAYARVAVTNDATEWPAASSGSKANANAVQFPTATADWGLITHYGLFDVASGGNLLMWGDLSPSQTVYSSDIPIIGAGDIVVNLD
jgi:hypothetical protein